MQSQTTKKINFMTREGIWILMGWKWKTSHHSQLRQMRKRSVGALFCSISLGNYAWFRVMWGLICLPKMQQGLQLENQAASWPKKVKVLHFNLYCFAFHRTGGHSTLPINWNTQSIGLDLSALRHAISWARTASRTYPMPVCFWHSQDYRD